MNDKPSSDATRKLPPGQREIDYQAIFAGAPALFLLLGAEEPFPILDASDGYLRATHTERDAILGRPLFEVFPDNPGDEQATGTTKLRSSLQGVLASGRADTMAVQKYDVRRAPGEGGGFEERYWSPVNAPVFDAGGRMLYIVHRVEDVTALVRENRALATEGDRLRLEVLARGTDLEEANRQLREVTEQFQAMYDQGLFAARLRLDGTVADINRSAIEVCGFERADVIDRPFWECGWWNRSPEVQAWVRNAVAQAVRGELFRGESRYFWGDGSEHVVDFACMPIRDAGGRVVVAIATGMDITERIHGERNQRALEAERQRSEALSEVDRAKTRFFSNVSHEFRTPLTLMLGPIEEALANPATPAAVRMHLELAHRNSLRLLKLVNNLLDFSRIEAGRADVAYEATALDVLTRDLASTFRSAMDRAGLAFTVDCEGLGEPAYVDREMWEKVVLNLLSNAFKFTLQGSVSVRLRREEGDAVLEIRDTGVGVPPHELPRLFERFHRVEGTHGRTQEGSGIGLALVQELVKLHGGTVSARSELGRGTTLRVSIPLGSAHLPPERIKHAGSPAATPREAQAFVQEVLRWIPGDVPTLVAAEPLPGRGFSKAAGARILLADDNADMRDYLRDLLSVHYAVEVVVDGAQALEAARRERPDLVVADVMMPRVDGLELLRRLRGDEALQDVPLILLSARAGEEARVEGLDAGADDYMVKPFSARELLARIAARLELVRMRRENEERFHAFVSATSDVIYRMSPDWSEMRSLKGRDFMADTDGPNFAWLDKYIYPQDQPLVMARIREAIQAKDVFELEHRVRRADGTVGWTLSRAVPLRDGQGDIVEWFGAASDVTVRKAAEQALQQRDAALSDADRRKDEFLAMLAHELRNPLAPIANASELLAHTLEGDARAQNAVGVIKRQVGHLTRLVDDLLDISRITQGRIQLKKRPVDVATLVAQAVEGVEAQLRAKHHKLTITAEADEPLFVLGDPARLMQCVGNVLINAIKYTEPGGEITIRTHGDASSASIEVRDSGSGIAPELLARVFDLFVQSERTLDRAQGGLGIGLAVVKRLVEMHGGQVSVHSAGVGLGSSFEIRLPRISQPARTRAAAARSSTEPRRVLVVDDNADAANSLAVLLTFQGHQVKVVYGAQEALAEVEEFKPEVGVLDIGLPDMNGYELAKALRAMRGLEGIRLVALTGYGQAEDYQRSRVAGFDEHLVKPVDLGKLERALAGLSDPKAGRFPEERG